MRGLIKNIHARFAGLNQNQRITLLATVFLIVLNFMILILGMKIFFRVLDKIG